jgi:hypothetical protein
MSAWKHPATVIATLALFAALGGTAAFASGLISGKKIINHSIPETKLTHGAIAALRAPTAISINKHVPSDSIRHLLRTQYGIDVKYVCFNNFVELDLIPHSAGDTVFASGDYAHDGTLVSLQMSSPVGVTPGGMQTVNLDVIAWSGSNGTLSRFDLGGYDGGAAGCNIWGLINPGSTN